MCFSHGDLEVMFGTLQFNIWVNNDNNKNNNNNNDNNDNNMIIITVSGSQMLVLEGTKLIQHLVRG